MTAVAAALVLVLIAAIYRVPTTAADTPAPTKGPGLGVSMREFGLVTVAGAVWALFNVSYIILVSFAPPLLIAHGISVKGAGIATSLASWTIIPTIALGGILLDRIGHATALMITSFAVLALSIMLMPSTSSFALIAFMGADFVVKWSPSAEGLSRSVDNRGRRYPQSPDVYILSERRDHLPCSQYRAHRFDQECCTASGRPSDNRSR